MFPRTRNVPSPYISRTMYYKNIYKPPPPTTLHRWWMSVNIIGDLISTRVIKNRDSCPATHQFGLIAHPIRWPNGGLAFQKAKAIVHDFRDQLILLRHLNEIRSIVDNNWLHVIGIVGSDCIAIVTVRFIDVYEWTTWENHPDCIWK